MILISLSISKIKLRSEKILKSFIDYWMDLFLRHVSFNYQNFKALISQLIKFQLKMALLQQAFLPIIANQWAHKMIEFIIIRDHLVNNPTRQATCSLQTRFQIVLKLQSLHWKEIWSNPKGSRWEVPTLGEKNLV